MKYHDLAAEGDFCGKSSLSPQQEVYCLILKVAK